MKKTIALLLALATLFLAACSSGIAQETVENTTAEATLENEEEKVSEEKKEDESVSDKMMSDYQPTNQVTDKLSWEKIDAFAKANENMTPAQARELCVSFFRFCQTFAWVPDATLTFERNSKGAKTTLTKGTVYGGLPYGGVSSGTVYRLMEFYNPETGVVNMKKATPGGETLYFANQCSMGAFQGWGRAINSAQYNWTEYMTQKNGFINVGPYTYDKNLSSFAKKTTKSICEDNGKDVMYQSYAAMQPADGLVEFGTSGHVIMCSGVNVVYSGGAIDEEKSSFTVIDQGQKYKEMEQSDGSKIMVQGGVDRTVTFKGAFESGYLPFTFAEFLGTDPIETATAEINVEGESVNQAILKKAVVTSNYSIADLYINILNQSGNVVYRKPVRVTTVNVKKIELASSVMGSMLKGYEDGTYRIQIEARLYTGDKITVLEASLTK